MSFAWKGKKKNNEEVFLWILLYQKKYASTKKIK